MRGVLAGLVLLGMSAFAAMAATPAGDPPARVTNPDWALKPSGDDLARHYPPAAMRQGLGGQATIQCAVKVDGYLKDCVVVSESPEGAGFGAATLAVAGTFRMTPQTRDGVPVEGATVRIPVVFQPPPPVTTPTAEEMEKQVGESFRRAFTPTPRDAAGGLAGLAGVLLLALLLDAPARRRRVGAPGAASVIGAGLTFIGPFWRRAALPALLYVVAAAGLQGLPYGPPALQIFVFPALLVISVFGVLVMGAGWRLALAGRGAAPNLAFKAPGLHFGGPELWSFLAPLVLTLIIMVGGFFLVLAGLALWFSATLVPGLSAVREVGAWTLAGLALGGVLALSAKLWLLTPVSILKRELAFGEAWRASEGQLWPAVAGMLLAQLVMTGPSYAVMYFAGRLPPIWSEPVFTAPWVMITPLLMVFTAGLGLPWLIGMKAAMVPSAD